MTTELLETQVMNEESGQSIVERGQALQRVQSEFTTAIAIQKPRDRKKVVVLCEEEATLAGDEFYYSWTVKGKSGNQLVEGLSVQGALSAARNWGNCAIPCRVEEQSDSYIFTATFVDFETGFNIQRTFRQRKKPNIGMKDAERAEDITFQIGQSKAIRNVVLNAIPSWLTSKMLVKAKENIIEKINKMGIVVARDKTIAFFQKYAVSLDRIEHKLGKKADRWNAEDLALLQGAMNTLLNGQESADSLFPSPSEKAEMKTATKTDELKEKLKQNQAPQSTPSTTPAYTEFEQKYFDALAAINDAETKVELDGLMQELNKKAIDSRDFVKLSGMIEKRRGEMR